MDFNLMRRVRVKVRVSYTVFQKTCDYVFDDNLNYNCPFATIFGVHVTESIGH